jgi:hypothetical protein
LADDPRLVVADVGQASYLRADLPIGVELVDSSGQHRVIDLHRTESLILASVIVELALLREYVRRRSPRYSTQRSMTTDRPGITAS